MPTNRPGKLATTETQSQTPIRAWKIVQIFRTGSTRHTGTMELQERQGKAKNSLELEAACESQVQEEDAAEAADETEAEHSNKIRARKNSDSTDRVGLG